MEIDTAMLKPGLKGRIDLVVDDKNTAKSLGSGALPVFGTPFLVAMMEAASIRAVEKFIPEGCSTVGTAIDIKHSAASPVGIKVWFESELVEVDRRALRFKVQGFDEKGLIGEGSHERFIIEVNKFMAKAEARKNG
jgi:predicted thioesterase